MPEEVVVRKDLGIIEIRSFGDISEEDLLSSRERVREAANELGITRVLVDAREETSMPSTMPLFDFAGSLARGGGRTRAEGDGVSRIP